MARHLSSSSIRECGLQVDRIDHCVVAVIGAVGMTILLWWMLSELTGLRRTFESPWVGVGDDVENAGDRECVLRAAVFVFVLWLCIAMIFPYVMSLLVFLGADRNHILDPDCLPRSLHPWRRPRSRTVSHRLIGAAARRPPLPSSNS